MLEECLCKACSRVSMCLALNVVYNLGMEPSEVGSESVGGALRFRLVSGLFLL